MTCQEVEELLDLFAADACDAPTRDTIENHLRRCDVCLTKLAECQRLQGMLDVHLMPGGLERLQQRIEDEAKPRRRARFLGPFVRGVELAAAILLIVFGLIWFLPSDHGTKLPGPAFALLVRTGKADADIGPKIPAKLMKDAEALVLIPRSVRGGDLRLDLLQAQREGKLPLPTQAPLELTLVNNGKRSVEVKLGDANANLSYEIVGEGVLRLPAPKAELPAPLQAQTMQMEPGKQLVFHVERLIAGAPEKLEYVYLTQAGEFDLTPSLRLTVDNQAITVKGTTAKIKVEQQPQ